MLHKTRPYGYGGIMRSSFFRNIVGARIARPQLVDISKPGLNSKIKKFSYSFICGKGYSPPSGGE